MISIQVKPDLSGFREALAEELERIAADLRQEVPSD